MNKELEKVNKDIGRLNQEIQQVNDECAEKLAEITGGGSTRLLSYGQEEELNKMVDVYTKKVAKLIVELEELEEIKKILME